MSDNLLIDPNSDEFQFFLIWLVESRDFKAKEIIDVVYSCHKYKIQMADYKQEEKLRRLYED